MRQLLRSGLGSSRLVVSDPSGHDYPEFPLVNHREFMYMMRTHRTRGDFQLRIVPQGPEHFIRISEYVLAAENLHYVIEEARLFKEAAQYEMTLVMLARMGGHYGQDLTYIAQRVQDVPPDVRSQMDEIYFFNMDEENDITIARNYLHELADAELPYLPKLHYFKKVRGQRDVERGVVSFAN